MTINGTFYPRLDGYMIAGPQWANYMLKVAPLYPATPFAPPPASMIGPNPNYRP